MTAEYANGILTIKLGIKGERQEAMKKVKVISNGE